MALPIALRYAESKDVPPSAVYMAETEGGFWDLAVHVEMGLAWQALLRRSPRHDPVLHC